MSDWLIQTLAQMQSGIVRTLAAELRAGGIGAAAFAFILGALHALTPGHGKAALAAYILGREASIGKGLRIALSAALLHVLAGFGAFLILRFLVGMTPSISGRGSPLFTMLGYALISLSGMMMLWQSLRSAHTHHDGSHALVAGMGLLPCPLTISVLGFAWLQSSAVMVGVTLVSLALGISLTIGLVAMFAILGRYTLGATMLAWGSKLDGSARAIQLIAGVAIIVIGIWAIVRLP